jgi:hypothetical protein
LSFQEDPPEDVFVSNVCDGAGNYRIFPGVWNSADFFLQQTLDVIASLPDDHDVREFSKSIRAFLRVSDAIADRRNLDRFSAGGGTPQITLYSDDWLAKITRALIFRDLDLRYHNIDRSDLEPFLLDLTKRNDILSESFGNTSVERRPLASRGGMIHVLLPTAFSLALRRYVLDWLAERGLLDAFTRNLARREAQLLDGCMNQFGATPHRRPVKAVQEGAPGMLTSVVATFDIGKYAHVVIIHEDAQDVYEKGLSSDRKMDTEEKRRIEEYIAAVAKELSAEADYSGGLTFLLFGGLGRGHFLSFPRLGSHWHVTGCGLSDFVLLSCDTDVSFRRLWKLDEQRDQLSEMGARFVDLGGLLNLYTFWSERGYHLIPADCTFPGPVLIALSTDFLAVFRSRVRQALDEHAVPKQPCKWVRVRRETVTWFFKELEHTTAYVSFEGLARRELYGVVETGERAWWIILAGKVPDTEGSLAFRLWEAIFRWMTRAAFVFEKEIPDLRKPVISVVITLGNLEKWLDQTSLGRSDVVLSANWAGASERREVHLRIPSGFLAEFGQATNIAERRCLEAIGRCLVEGTEAHDRVPDMVRSVMPDDHARFLHLLETRDFRTMVRAEGADAAPMFICPEDESGARFGLAWLVMKPGPEQQVRGRDECTDLLNHLADKVWVRIREVLNAIERASLIEMVFKNLDALERDRSHWRITARAVLATQKDRSDVLDVAGQHEFRRSSASLATRVLAEMAVCTCRVGETGRPLTRTVFDRLLAEAMLLVNIGSYSDGVRLGFVDPELGISASGSISFQTSFQENIVNPRAELVFASGFEAAAEEYERLFETKEAGGSSHLEPEFIDAFHKEYNIFPKDLARFVVAVQDHALTTNQRTLHCTENDLCHIASGTELGNRDVEAILEKFVLPARPKWDEPSPVGFRQKDWYPWRFRRRLSLISRPIVPLEREQEPAYMISPGVLEDALRYVLRGAYLGSFEQDYFDSSEMKAWTGEVNSRRGHEFNLNVARRFAVAGFKTSVETPVSAITGVSSDKNLGDVDVLAWKADNSVVIAVECKSLHFAKTLGEIAEQLRRFRGQTDSSGRPDELLKHLKRLDELRHHHEAVARFTRMERDFTIEAYLVFSGQVPMKFVDNMPVPPKHVLMIDEIAPDSEYAP